MQDFPWKISPRIFPLTDVLDTVMQLVAYSGTGQKDTTLDMIPIKRTAIQTKKWWPI